MTVRIMRIAAIAKAISNSPLSLAYTYKATVSVAPALPRPLMKPFTLCANPAVNRRAADSLSILPIERMHPVMMPFMHVGRTTVLMTLHLPAPSANAPSL